MKGLKEENSEVRKEFDKMKEKILQLTAQSEKNEKLRDSYKHQIMALKLEHTHLQEKHKDVKC